MSLETFIESRPRRLTDWLEKNKSSKWTKGNYRASLKNWIKCHYGNESVTNFMGGLLNLTTETIKRNKEKRINEIEEGIERYFSELDNRDFTDDFKTFLNWARKEGYTNRTIHTYSNTNKVFFSRQDPRCKISDEDWDDIKGNLLPKSKRAATRDDILTKGQLKKVLQHLSIQAKAMALFLLSTGVRIGAAVQIRMSDINLDSDPPYVDIKDEYTKGKASGRRIWFSYEARDAIIEWHKARLFKEKPGYFGLSDKNRSYDMDNVFNLIGHGFNLIWNRALKRADGARALDPSLHVLCKRDSSTKLRVHVYHVHTLRKFFSTNMKLAGVPDVVVHAWMGHKKYLEEAYGRYPKVKLAEIYKEHMNVVTVYEVSISDKASAKYKAMVEKAEKVDKLEDQTREDKAFIRIVGGQLGAFIGLTDEEIAVLSYDERRDLIINKVAQLKADAVRSREEMEKVAKRFLPTINEGEKG